MVVFDILYTQSHGVHIDCQRDDDDNDDDDDDDITCDWNNLMLNGPSINKLSAPSLIAQAFLSVLLFRQFLLFTFFFASCCSPRSWIYYFPRESSSCRSNLRLNKTMQRLRSARWNLERTSTHFTYFFIFFRFSFTIFFPHFFFIFLSIFLFCCWWCLYGDDHCLLPSSSPASVRPMEIQKNSIAISHWIITK